MFYKLEGKKPVPCTVDEFEELYRTGSRCISLTHNDDKTIEISTVFVGVDPTPIVMDKPAQLFETIVFENGIDVRVRRYSTWDEAANGHTELEREFLIYPDE